MMLSSHTGIIISHYWGSLLTRVSWNVTCFFFHAHTVDGSEIPNNHLGCIKPCKPWDIYPLIGSLSYSLQVFFTSKCCRMSSFSPVWNELFCSLMAGVESDYKTYSYRSLSARRGSIHQGLGKQGFCGETGEQRPVQDCKNTCRYRAQMKCYSKWISQKTTKPAKEPMNILYAMCTLRVPGGGSFVEMVFGCQHTLEKHIP